MTLTVSAAVLLGIAALIILRARHVSYGNAVVLFLFGFFTAGTGAYGPIYRLCAAIATAIPRLTS
ncbi:hypothetical protein [Streptomyces triculaminicus]|uniref:hypothetical protein n=1 Tax=Streptomyces triculaminicus TaxID=2816232 RepID=UPI0037BDE2B5